MAETNNGPLHILMKRNSTLKSIIDKKKKPTPEISLFRSEPKRNSKEKPRKTSSLINSYIPQISKDFVHKYSCINLILPDSDDIFFDIKNLLEYFMQFEFLNQAKSSNKTFLAKSSDKTVLYPELNLFIWSLLLNRIELAKYFWRIGSVGA